MNDKPNEPRADWLREEYRKKILQIKNRIDSRLNDHLCEMNENEDDSITGFNKAWDLVRELFNDELGQRNDNSR